MAAKEKRTPQPPPSRPFFRPDPASMLSSSPSEGSPCGPVHGADAARDRMDIPRLSAASELPRLLLIEKDAAMRTMLLKTLAADYSVEGVGDALEACQAVKVRPPALVVIDLYHPGTDSLTLIRAMRAEERTAQVRIIILTVSMHKELLLRCLSAGASNFLLKPFNSAELLLCARVELQMRGAHAEPTR